MKKLQLYFIYTYGYKAKIFNHTKRFFILTIFWHFIIHATSFLSKPKYFFRIINETPRRTWESYSLEPSRYPLLCSKYHVKYAFLDVWTCWDIFHNRIFQFFEVAWGICSIRMFPMVQNPFLPNVLDWTCLQPFSVMIHNFWYIRLRYKIKILMHNKLS